MYMIVFCAMLKYYLIEAYSILLSLLNIIGTKNILQTEILT